MDEGLTLWNVNLYDVSDNFVGEDNWKRYSTIYVGAKDFDEAQKIAKKHVGENQVITGINESGDSNLFIK